MKKILFTITILLFAFSTSIFSMKIKGVNLPEEITINNTKCYLNGAGVRKKFFFSIYVIGLYLPNKLNDASEVINLNKDKGVLMVFTYHKISSKKIKNAWIEGFEKYSNYNIIKDKVNKFNSFFDNEVKKGDKFFITYSPKNGTCVYINDNKKGCIEGEEFMKGLFSIWLGDKPISKGLKNKLLGK